MGEPVNGVIEETKHLLGVFPEQHLRSKTKFVEIEFFELSAQPEFVRGKMG